MALSEKGRFTLDMIQKYFTVGTFSAKSLSDICGEKISAASLTSLAKKGYLNKIQTSPVTYSFDKEFAENCVEEVAPQAKVLNTNLREARRKKNDEFYTRREDIEAELNHYRKYFAGKTVFLNCDDPRESEFWLYFERQFGFLGLKKLISTHYEENGSSYKLEYTGSVSEDGDIDEATIIKTPLKENGDFRSDECIAILKDADIVVTNPPFSLFREFIATLIKYDKKFLVVGNKNATTYKETFKLFQNNQLWWGMTNPKKFYVPKDYSAKNVEQDKSTGKPIAKFGNICWFTNLPTKKRNEEISTGARYYDENHKPEDYPKYDNYDAIDISKVANIPMDYEGVMGVPITFLDKYNPMQFEILGDSRYHDGSDLADDINFVDGKQKYTRVLIRNKHPRKPRNK